MGFFNNIIEKFKNASRERFIVNKKENTIQILLDTNHEQYFTLTFENMNVNRPTDTNVVNAYSINATNAELDDLYLEAIEIDNIKSWNMSAGSAFDRLLKKELTSHKLEYISSFENNFCSLKKYTIDNTFDIGVIWFSLNSTELFILDQKGKLFNDLLAIYDIKDEKLLIKEKEHEKIIIKKSLTEDNIMENYF